MTKEEMKHLKLFLIVFVFLSCSSCIQNHENIISHTEMMDEYVITFEAAKENALKLAKVSEFKTCFIRACLGSHIDKLPYEMVLTLNEIDALINEIGDSFDMNDCQKGQLAGLWIRLVALGILEAVAEINPSVLAGLL